MIWSEVCIDESKGYDWLPCGRLRPRSYGAYVMTIEEARECLVKRGLIKCIKSDY